jgi:hypothetical protein
MSIQSSDAELVAAQNPPPTFTASGSAASGGKNGDVHFRTSTSKFWQNRAGTWVDVTWGVNAVLAGATQAAAAYQFTAVPPPDAQLVITSASGAASGMLSIDFRLAEDGAGGADVTIFIDGLSAADIAAEVRAAVNGTLGSGDAPVTAENGGGWLYLTSSDGGADRQITIAPDWEAPGAHSGTDPVSEALVKAAEAGRRHLILNAAMSGGDNAEWGLNYTLYYGSVVAFAERIGGAESNLLNLIHPTGRTGLTNQPVRLATGSLPVGETNTTSITGITI